MKAVIAIVSITALLAVAGAVIVGSRSFEGIVVDKPYEKGLLWDKERKEREKSGLSVKTAPGFFKIGNNSLMVYVTDNRSAPVADANLRITISRPATNKYNSTYELRPDGSGIYSASVDLPLYGYWDAYINVVREGHDITFKEKIFAEK